MLLKLISPSFCSPLGSSSLITVYSLYRLSSSLARRPFAVAAMSSSTSTPMNPPTHTSPSPPAGLAPIEGLPIAAQAVLHRELCHIHSSLQLILTILRGPWDTLAPPLADTITCPLLLAHLRGLDASIDQTKRATCTTLLHGTTSHCSWLATYYPLRPRSHSIDCRASRPDCLLGSTSSVYISFLPPTTLDLLPSFFLTRSFDTYFDAYHWTTPSCYDYTFPPLLHYFGVTPSYDIDEDDALSIPVSFASWVGVTQPPLGVRVKRFPFPPSF